MFFNKRKGINTTPSVSQDVNAESVLEQTPASEISPSEEPHAQVNLFGKLRRRDSYSGPETSYENEAWAPESNSLFRKRRPTTDDPTS